MKGVKDGFYMIIKGPWRQFALLNAGTARTIQWAERPRSADIFIFDVPVAIDKLNKPDVPVKIILCHIESFSAANIHTKIAKIWQF